MPKFWLEAQHKGSRKQIKNAHKECCLEAQHREQKKSSLSSHQFAEESEGR